MLVRLDLSVVSWDSDVVMIGHAIACGRQELTRIKCVLQTSSAQQPNTIPSYRNCHSHQTSTLISHIGHVGICLQGADTSANEGFTF